MPPRRIVLASILISSVFATGCKEVAKSIGDLMVVRNELVTRFGDTVTLNIVSGKPSRLLVNFVNSVLNDRSGEERFKRAQETAQVVKTYYPGIQSVDQIWVAFLRAKTEYVIITRSEGIDWYGFDKDGRPLRDPEPGNYRSTASRVQPGITYLDNSDETDVSVSGIQLEGEPGRAGLTLLPHFRARGDARSARLPSPKAVAFDFASYSDRERFPQEVTPITFFVDGKSSIAIKGKFSVSNVSDGVAEFCYLTISYPQFRRLTAGKSLTIKLGAKEYPLTPEQFEGLKKMNDYVKE